MFMTTESGSKLLISGWWGWLQHPNYLWASFSVSVVDLIHLTCAPVRHLHSGDLIITAAWCATTGAASAAPYFQIVYFVILLAHRQLRDDEAWAKKSVFP
jgi:delta14-sterol reductase